jgi:hypothetical protein
MKKQKMPKDINELAAKIVALATQEKPEKTPEPEEPKQKKGKESKS